MPCPKDQCGGMLKAVNNNTSSMGVPIYNFADGQILRVIQTGSDNSPNIREAVESLMET